MNNTNIIAEKTKQFAIRIIKFAKFLRQEGVVDVIIVRQLLKSGTSIGANTRESSNAQSNNLFEVGIERVELFLRNILGSHQQLQPIGSFVSLLQRNW